MDTIFDKTDKGREEITTRKHKLPTRMRSLLLLLDGKHAAQEVLQKVAGLGLTSQHIVELLENGFIRCASTPEWEDEYDEAEIETSAMPNTQPLDVGGTPEVATAP